MSAAKRFFCWFISIDWTPDAVTAAGTIALAILTFVLAIGTLFLWRATRRLVRDGEKTAERQLRAYVSLENIEPATAISNAVNPIIFGYSFSGKWKNVGQTPAIDLDAIIVAALLNPDECDPVIIEVTEPPQKISVSVGPTINASTNSVWYDINQIVSVWRGEKRLFLFFRATYADVFNPRRRHPEEICVEVKVQSDPTAFFVKDGPQIFGFSVFTKYEVQKRDKKNDSAGLSKAP